jgi:hypothetical protein
VRVSEALNPGRAGLHVDVVVRAFTVPMRRSTNAQAATQRPEADADQRRANDPLAPRREDIDRRQKLTKEYAKKSHHHDARCVAKSPRPSGDPTFSTPVHGKRRHGSEVIGPGEYVKETGQGAGH